MNNVMAGKTYELLNNIYDKYEAQEFGKLCQQMLALALNSAGFEGTEVWLVEGVDIYTVSKSGQKYAVEVKTTKENVNINFGSKDRDGLLRCKKDGCQPAVAVLRLDMSSGWIFANADNLKQGSISINNFRARRLTEFEKIAEFFDNIVKEHYDGVMRDGQRYLNDILRQKGIKVSQ